MNIEQVLQKQVGWMEKRLDEIQVKVDGVETKVDIVELKVDGVETKVDGIEETVNEMSATVNKVYEKLAGNELSPGGLIEEFETVKKEVNNLKEFKNKVIWSGSILLAIGGLIGYLITLFFNFLSVKK